MPTLDKRSGQRLHACGAGEFSGVGIDAVRTKLSQDKLIDRVTGELGVVDRVPIYG